MRKVGKIERKTYETIDTYKEFILLEYKRGKSAKVFLKCLSCGHEFERYAHHFNNYPHNCPKCRPRGSSLKLTLEEAQKRVDEIFGKGAIKLLAYKGNNTLTPCLCLKCEEEFEAVPTSLWRRRIKGCPVCSEVLSLGEQTVRLELEKIGEEYIMQHRFSDCCNIFPLPFDFFLPKRKTCIEFHGEQHYKERSLYYSEALIQNDKIKKEYCEKKGIKLIVIPYWEIKNIKNFLIFDGED